MQPLGRKTHFLWSEIIYVQKAKTKDLNFMKVMKLQGKQSLVALTKNHVVMIITDVDINDHSMHKLCNPQ